MITKGFHKQKNVINEGFKIDLGIKAVRDCGKTNMFDKQAVMYWAFKMGFFETVNFFNDENNKGNIISRMNNTEFNLLPNVDHEYLISLEDEVEAREFVEEEYFK
jgi:hypothetical protein